MRTLTELADEMEARAARLRRLAQKCDETEEKSHFGAALRGRARGLDEAARMNRNAAR